MSSVSAPFKDFIGRAIFVGDWLLSADCENRKDILEFSLVASVSGIRLTVVGAEPYRGSTQGYYSLCTHRVHRSDRTFKVESDLVPEDLRESMLQYQRNLEGKICE